MKNENSDPINKAIRLFSYLEKTLNITDTLIRDFRKSCITPSPWWLAELPTDLDNLEIKRFETEVTNEDKEGAWLHVEKTKIEPAPSLPKELTAWVEEVTPLEEPKAKEKISFKVLFEDNPERVKKFDTFKKNYIQGDLPEEDLQEWIVLSDNKLPSYIEQRYVEDLWMGHAELISLLQGYIENEWKPWADKVKKAYKANLIYDQLYALRLMLKNEGDNYELLWGNCLLTWKHIGVGEIYSPIFLTPVNLEFDPAKRIMNVIPDPLYKGFSDISSLFEMDNRAEIDLISWSDKINSDPFNFWHLETLKTQARVFASYVSTDSEDNFKDEISTPPSSTENPTIWNCPVLFARKRSNDLWAKYARLIRQEIEQNNAEPTNFIMDLVGAYENKETSDNDSNIESNNGFIKEAELFFPLPWNEEQKRIAERLEHDYGVVVKGPPGTGKSHTIANLISRFLSQGKTVLVTSQTSKALEVIRDKLPENIRSLAVSQLNQSAKQDDVLQQSISEISSNLGERHTKFSEQKADLIRKELHEVRKQMAELANQIRQYILTDSNESIKINGEDIRPIDAAKIVAEHRNNCSWLKDKISLNTEITFNDNDLKVLVEKLKELETKERDYFSLDLPTLELVPNENVLTEKFSQYKKLKVNTSEYESVFGIKKLSISLQDSLKIIEQMECAKKFLESLKTTYEVAIFDNCSKNTYEREMWQLVVSKIKPKQTQLRQNNANLLGHEVLIPPQIPLRGLLHHLLMIKEKIGNKKKLNSIEMMLLPSEVKNAIRYITVDGESINSPIHINLAIDKVANEQLSREIRNILQQSFEALPNNENWDVSNFDNGKAEQVVNTIEKITEYFDNYKEIDQWCKENKELTDYSYCKLQDVTKLLSILSSYTCKHELDNLQNDFESYLNYLKSFNNKYSHSVVLKLVNAITAYNIQEYNKALVELRIISEKQNIAQDVKDLSNKINASAPTLYEEIIHNMDAHKDYRIPENLEMSWKVRRLESWLESIHKDTGDLQSQLERLVKKEQLLNSELVTCISWQRQIDKVTKKQRDALMNWANEMKRYGKGTGKWAPRHLRAAQESLKEAINAVPVWIMPLHKAAQMFPDPKAGLFDVVIFDEASQCDIRGLTIAYLGKKLLVVGDPDQISPAGVFVNQEKTFELISRFLFDIPFKENFSVTSSLFDLAKVRIPSIIQLNEHFRCVPEIIAFNNHHIYEGKLRPLRYPQPKGLLKPALVPVCIKDGYQNLNNKVNEPEAHAIVDKLVECINSPRYQERPNGKLCTFGIISLLAEDQAKYIEKLIRDRIASGDLNEKVIEERKILCGDAYKFQGDERDVMFLSMVRAHNPSNPNDTINPLVTEDAKQRFNVAVSRARDQVFLFHSVSFESLSNKNDWRYKLLNWFYNPINEELNAGRETLKREFDFGRASQFSYDVGNILIDRGYQVLPEYPVIGYRIDLVIQGKEARLAVECDGDQYHTLENWEEDQLREKQLRRAGWEFWRVTGSAFYRNKEKALDSLWTKLTEMGIEPLN